MNQIYQDLYGRSRDVYVVRPFDKSRPGQAKTLYTLGVNLELNEPYRAKCECNYGYR